MGSKGRTRELRYPRLSDHNHSLIMRGFPAPCCKRLGSSENNRQSCDNSQVVFSKSGWHIAIITERVADY
jgi:hypothetical protein